MPFTTLVQDHTGYCGPCPNNSGTFNFTQVSIDHRWLHDQPSKLRQTHLQGRIAKECERCRIEESAGHKSVRHWMNEIYGANPLDVLSKPYHEGPETMVLRVSNLCNFACRSCHAVDSSSWRREGKYYADQYEARQSRYIPEVPLREFSLKEMEVLYGMTQRLKSLQFFGGEPMMNVTHHKLLELLVKSGRAKEIELFYCTNTSHYPSEEKIKLWSSFKKLTLNLSIDGLGPAFEYLRYGGNWLQTQEHIERFRRDLPEQIGIPVVLSSTVTLTSMNILHFVEVDQWLIERMDPGLFLTFAHDPAYFCIKNIPERYKTQIEALIRKKSGDKYNFVIQFMKDSVANDRAWLDFLRWTKRMDLYRGQQFAEVFPDLFEIFRADFESVQDLSEPASLT